VTYIALYISYKDTQACFMVLFLTGRTIKLKDTHFFTNIVNLKDKKTICDSLRVLGRNKMFDHLAFFTYVQVHLM